MHCNTDPLLKEAVHEQINNVIPPPKEEMWENIKNGLVKNSKRKSFKFSRFVIATCIALVIFISLALFDTPVKAFSVNIIRSIEEIIGDTLIVKKIVGYDNNNETLDEVKSQSGDPRIDGANGQVSFEILIPSYIPVDYELYTVDVFNKVKENESVTLLYINTKDKHKREGFEIAIRSLPIGSEIDINYVINDDTVIEHITINDIECTLLNYGERDNELFWDKHKLSYTIGGNISKEEIIKIAKSLKPIN